MSIENTKVKLKKPFNKVEDSFNVYLLANNKIDPLHPSWDITL